MFLRSPRFCFAPESRSQLRTYGGPAAIKAKRRGVRVMKREEELLRLGDKCLAAATLTLHTMASLAGRFSNEMEAVLRQRPKKKTRKNGPLI